MNWLRLFVACLVGLATNWEPAPRPAIPAPFVIASHNRSFYLRAVPNREKPLEADLTTISGYKVGYDSCDTAMWSATGWYASDLHLCDDGHHLVRIVQLYDLPYETPPDGSHEPATVLVFYRDGKVLRSVSKTELDDLRKSLPSRVGRSYETSDWTGTLDTDFISHEFRLHIDPSESVLFDVTTGAGIATIRAGPEPGR